MGNKKGFLKPQTFLDTDNQWLDIEMSLKMGVPISIEFMREALQFLLSRRHDLPMKEQLQELQSRVDDMESDKSDLENEVDDLKSKLEDYKNDGLTERIERLEETIEKLENRNYELRKDVNREKAKHNDIYSLYTKAMKELSDAKFSEVAKKQYSEIVATMKILEKQLMRCHRAD